MCRIQSRVWWVSRLERSERKTGVCRDFYFQGIWLELRGAASMDEMLTNRYDQPNPVTGWVQPE